MWATALELTQIPTQPVLPEWIEQLFTFAAALAFTKIEASLFLAIEHSVISHELPTSNIIPEFKLSQISHC